MTKKASEPTSRGEGVIQTLMSMPGVQAIAKKFAEATLTVELKAPDEQTLALLAQDPQEILKKAQDAVVSNDDEYKLAKQASDSLKDEADLIEAKRTGEGSTTGGTKGLNVIKASWDSLFMPVKKADEAAAKIYQNKMRAYEQKLRDDDKREREEKAKAAAAERKRLLDEAEALEKKAASLKTAAKKEEVLRKAEQNKATAAMIPEEYAATGSSVPDLGSGGKSERWVGEVDEDDQEFAAWLVKNPEWRRQIVSYGTAGLNDLAKHVKDAKTIPGFTAKQSSSYRRESKRNP